MDTSVRLTDNRRFIEVELSEEGTTITILLTAQEAQELRDGLRRELNMLRSLRK